MAPLHENGGYHNDNHTHQTSQNYQNPVIVVHNLFFHTVVCPHIELVALIFATKTSISPSDTSSTRLMACLAMTIKLIVEEAINIAHLVDCNFCRIVSFLYKVS